MESQQENPNYHKGQFGKDYVDFYGNIQDKFQGGGPKRAARQDYRDGCEMEIDFEVEAVQIKGSKGKQPSNNQNYYSGNQPSDINSKLQKIKSSDTRRFSQEKYGTRQSLESKDKLNQLRQLEQQQQCQNLRQMAGAKSIMSNYGSNDMKLLGNPNPNLMKERPIDADPNGLGDTSQKSTLQKVSSQNRLLIAQQEQIQSAKQATISQGKSSKNQQEKISFFKEQQQDKNSLQGHGQDLLYKHHLQYSHANHSTKTGTYQLKTTNQHILTNCSTKECTFCRTNFNHQSAFACSAIFCSQNQLGVMIQNQLSKKYSTNRDYYNVKIVNDLIYNENTHIVSIFKDYLILDDINEFLKRPYTTAETKVRLPKLCSFYDKYSQVFPNYVVLPESKYMFKNIQRKQKLIDEVYQIQEEQAKKQQQSLADDDKLFNSKFYNSVYRQTDLSMSRQQYEDQAKQIASQIGRQIHKGGRFEEMRIEDLVERFLVKDSESNIQLITTAGIDFSMQNSMMDKAPNFNQAKETKQQVQSKGPSRENTLQKKQGGTVKKVQEFGGKKTSQGNVGSVLSQGLTNSNTRKQKGSFNSTAKQSNKHQEIVKQVANKDQNGSSKNTPRFQKNAGIVMDQQLPGEQTTSPATKEALSNYLQGQLDSQNSNSKVTEVRGIETNMKAMAQLESPSLKSPTTQSMKSLVPSQSQTQLQSSGLRTNLHNRQNMLPATSLGTNVHLNNLKKQQRQSHDPASKHIAAKKVFSPTNPSAQQQQISHTNQSNGSRNGINNSSGTNKQTKSSVNSHAKYLSGGSEQYQRLLNPSIIGQQTMGSTDTFTSANMNSSTKKQTCYQTKIKSSGKNQQIHEVVEGDMITGEDCDEHGIADERFASPDMYITDDTVLRKSADGRGHLNQYNQILISCNEEKMLLSQYSNYDQIKKHLEQFISPNQQPPFSQSLVESQHPSVKKVQYSKIQENKGSRDLEYKRHGSHRNTGNGGQGVSGQASYQSDSRNASTSVQKQFESLKNRIRGAFEKGEAIPSASPNQKLHSTKNQNNRMSLEAKEILMNANNIQGCLSSTSAAGRTLSFNQTGFNNTQNYRSITNLNNRKTSKNNLRESMNESQKRYSQNRASFKELQAHEKIIKRCATGKVLHINEVQQHTFGAQQNPHVLNQVQSTTSLLNPTFIGNNSINQSKNSTSAAQQQAANTVRVLTPSYSLASLSKMVTPNNQASPMTMTVTVAGQNRKNATGALSNQNFHSHHQNNPSFGSSGSPAATFTLADKSSKMVKGSGQSTLSSKVSRMTKQASNAVQFNKKTGGGGQTQMQQKDTIEVQRRQFGGEGVIQESSQNLSCTVSTENNSGMPLNIKAIEAKALESKHPKFMKTIEEVHVPGQQSNKFSNSLSQQQRQGLTGSTSLANLDLKIKQALQTNIQSNPKKMSSALASSQSTTHFKSPSQQIQTKKIQGRYQQF